MGLKGAQKLDKGLNQMIKENPKMKKKKGKQ
jgi:hypothetical protein